MCHSLSPSLFLLFLFSLPVSVHAVFITSFHTLARRRPDPTFFPTLLIDSLYFEAVHHIDKHQGRFLRVAPILPYLVLGNDPAPVWSQDLLPQPYPTQRSAVSHGGSET